MSERLQPAFWGGLFIGVFSVLPFISIGNCCCCLWVVAGGVLAAYLRQQQTPYAIAASEGALVGLLAGVIGALVTGVLSIPMQAITGPMQQRMFAWLFTMYPDMPPELRDAFERASRDAGSNGMGLVVNFVFYLFAGLIFGMLGGLLGVAIFKKNAPPPPPPPPPYGTMEVLPPEA